MMIWREIILYLELVPVKYLKFGEGTVNNLESGL